MTTQVIEEVIECEIGNINIQHPDPVEINNDISLPVKDDKLVQLQKNDPHTNELRKQWEYNNLDKNIYTMENNILKRENHRKQISVHTQSSPRHPKSLPTNPSTQQTRQQQFQENLCITQKQIQLERHKEISTPALHKLQSMCKTQHQDTTAQERTLFITTPAHGIHSNGLNRRIPPSIQ